MLAEEKKRAGSKRYHIMSPIVVGICGGSGSGKTTVANRLLEAFEGRSLLLSMDFYYRRHDELTYEQRCKINYDHPDSLDIALMIEHLRSLKRGEKVSIPQYDFTVHNRKNDVTVIESRPLIIVEGILLFSQKELMDLIDIPVFVDADADVRVLRRVKRDMTERGRSIDSVMSQYLATVKPMHDKYVEPYKDKASLILSGDEKDDVAVERFIDTIRKKLEINE